MYVTRYKLAVGQPIGSLTHLHQNTTERLLIPKYGGSLILESITNRICQVDFRSLRGLGFVFKRLCKMKPGDQC